MSISEKLKKLREEKSKKENRNISRLEVSKIIDVDNSTYGKWENGIREPGIDYIVKLARYYDVSVDYLTDNSANDIIINEIDKEMSERIPVVGVIKAGYNMYAEQNILGYKYTDKSKTKGKECFWLKVTGDSMNAVGIFNNSLVLVEKKSIVDNKKIAIVRINGNEATVKQVIFNDNHVILQPRSTDQSYLPQIIKEEDFTNGYAEIIGEVIDVSFNPNELFK